MPRQILTCMFLVAVLIVPFSVSAHHGLAAYDMTKSITVKGTITEFAFINPHSAIHLDATDEHGKVESWLVEADSPNNLSRAHWTKESLKAGDQVSIVGNRAKDGSKVMRLQKVIFANGQELKPREADEY